jgi:isopentenyl-diphosphate delta-isomerase
MGRGEMKRRETKGRKDLKGKETIQKRKAEHLQIVLQGNVESPGHGGFEGVYLPHESLPEMDLSQVECSTFFLGKKISFPLLITGMTGGAEEGRKINQRLAEVAESFQIPLGVGSMRPLLGPKPPVSHYDLRKWAPTIPLLGNIGATQAKDLPPERMKKILEDLGYDGLCIHLNPAQELSQKEGDTDFRGIVSAIEQYQECFGDRLIVKETGCGLSPTSLDLLRSSSVTWVDVSGKGGTSFPLVEGLRNPEDPFGELLNDWGIPTVPSLLFAKRRGFLVIASGGVRTPLDHIKSLVLGARLCGIARPALVAVSKGKKVLEDFLSFWKVSFCKIMVLLKARALTDLPSVPYVLSPEVKIWLSLDREKTCVE